MTTELITTAQKGYVYILSNPSLAGILKIGASRTGGSKRADELYSSGVPSKFNLEFEIMSYDIFSDESRVHAYLDNYRVSDDREFFNVDLKTAIINLTNDLLIFAILNKISSGSIYDAVKSIKEFEAKQILGG